MKKTAIAGFLGTVFLITAATGGLAAESGSGATAPEQTITIAGKKPVRFKHSVHLKLGLDCGTCHHDASHQPLTESAIAALPDSSHLQCATCHNKNFTDPKLGKRKNVFHGRCRTCHKAGVAGKKGPTKCSSCHLKKKKKIEGC